ncbi:MAG TPA: DNA gyrase subunit A [Polyangia bacterium]|jgi:DNA gyrase subunit A|nr:DNA gyrase subunit A [Polyangia bacterium]
MSADGAAPPPFAGNRIPISIEEEMKSAFMDYAMSVIVSRALPDARDGLKPVHRRILYTQHGLSNYWNRPYIKCARVVGDVLGKYHPHGDTAAYDALVRMAQDFAMRYTLVDGQGNFGSVDGDSAAAYRYTECRMEKIGGELLADIDKETVDFQPNYDDKETEPTVLPARFPNLLVNGAAGIAVGMATNIPPHNLREVIDATIAVIKNPDLTTDELIEIVPGPDFPTGGFISGRHGIRNAYETGRGAILMRGRTTVEEHPKTGRKSIIATEIPYQVNKAKLIEKIAELVRDKRIEGIADLRDESDRDGMRIVIDLKKDAVPEIVQNNLWKMTPLQESFGINMLAIVDGRPQILSLKKALTHYIGHRRDVVTRRTLFDLRQARDRMHILEGLKIAVDNIDAVIDLIRASKDTEAAKAGLMSSFELSARQAQAILDMRLAKLTGLERDALIAEIKEVGALIARLEEILGSEKILMSVVTDELEAVKKEFGDDRRTEIIDAGVEIGVEDMIVPEEMVVTVTHGGYVKRNPKTLYRAQRRGGRGITGAATHEEDFVAQLFVASTHDTLLMITNKGRAYSKKVWEVPQAGRTAKGKAFVNLIPLQEGERVVALLPVREFSEGAFVVMATRTGYIKKTSLDAFANIRSSGIIALTIPDDDDLVAVRITEGTGDILIGTRNGWAIRFREENVRPMGRTARGVRGIRLRVGDSDKDQVVGMSVIPREEPATLLTVCERGYGKRTPTSDYPTKNRGGKGVITIKTTERNGKVVSLRLVSDDDDLMLITDGGKLIRMPVDGIPTIGRNTQGVRLIRLETEEKVVAMERMAEKEEGETEVAPEVAAARAELQAETLGAEDLGDEAAADEAQDDEAQGDEDDDDDEDDGESGEGGDESPGDES